MIKGIVGRRRRRSDGGVALVEFALIAPILLAMVFGIIELGWLFMNTIDLRHGAREGARLAAVDFKTTASPTPIDQQTQLLTEICSRMDADDDVSVNLYRPGGAGTGEEIQVTVRIADYNSLSGFFPFLEGDSYHSTVVTRVEQDASWQSMADASTFRDCP